jgi:ectoine hydroxylase-related dioxygenase (phytanoyl-CoA dioxygenase family)
LPGVMPLQACAQVLEAWGGMAPGSAGTRALLGKPWCQALAVQLLRHPAIARAVPKGRVVVQATLFTKSSATNWLVPWHQDTSLPVAQRVDDPALPTWSIKEGVWHVQAPEPLLAQMLALRLHLDPCGPDDGPLRVLPGTHRQGRLTDADVTALATKGKAVVCTAAAGDVLLMHPLLLHASSKARGHSQRRVLHLLLGPTDLPHGLRWPPGHVSA